MNLGLRHAIDRAVRFTMHVGGDIAEGLSQAHLQNKTKSNLFGRGFENGQKANGSDGIHMRWDPVDNLVDVYFGESKLYTDVGAALTSAFTSIEGFHANGMREHEYAMVTKHFKGVDEHLKRAVVEVLDTGKPPPDARINHACLIGYDWAMTGATPAQALAAIEAEYQRQYLADAPRLHSLLQTRFNNCQRNQYRFEVFFLPFTSVQAFRDAFNHAME